MGSCNCSTCTDLKMLQEKGVPEQFIDYWMDYSMTADVNAAILDGSWPNAIEILEQALAKAKTKGAK